MSKIDIYSQYISRQQYLLENSLVGSQKLISEREMLINRLMAEGFTSKQIEFMIEHGMLDERVVKPKSDVTPMSADYKQPSTVTPMSADYKQPSTVSPMSADYKQPSTVSPMSADYKQPSTVSPMSADYKQPSTVSPMNADYTPETKVSPMSNDAGYNPNSKTTKGPRPAARPAAKPAAKPAAGSRREMPGWAKKAFYDR